MKNNVLSGRELLRDAYELLSSYAGGHKVDFAEPVQSVIADDSDDHRMRRGTMDFERAHKIATGANQFAIAFGTKGGNYPGGEYDSCIVAARIASVNESDEDIATKILHAGYYFEGAVVVCMAGGGLALPLKGGGFGPMMLAAFQQLNQDQEKDGFPLKLPHGKSKVEDGFLLTAPERNRLSQPEKYPRGTHCLLAEAMRMVLAAYGMPPLAAPMTTKTKSTNKPRKSP